MGKMPNTEKVERIVLKINKLYNCDEDVKDPLLSQIVYFMSQANNLRYNMGISNGDFYVAKHIRDLVIESLKLNMRAIEKKQIIIL